MGKTLLAAVIMMLAGPVAASEAHQFCAMSWASAPAQFERCVNQQIRGAQSVTRYLDWAKATDGPDSMHVIRTFELCRRRWSPDYGRIDNCLRARAGIAPP
ncbi:MAG: hypothetical protein ACPGGK_05405 [Pikeienuella sp.]